ncbi:MAG: rhodanese-like domain-containing protein [Burkholderiales bacterium]|jgi:phage shock protein E|nr:rhodanese-like domain-containing protein [Burkholderiales bacterium]
MGNRWKYGLAVAALAVGVFAVGLMGVSVNASAAEPVFLIDVRSPQEFAEGYLVGAVNIDYREIVAKIGSVTSDKNARIELYCRSGRRSGIAQNSLREAGYQNAVNLGGFEALRKTRAATR